mmetsp:Transcript_39146/g.103528  ORF Transcript_39146/g.103528 Transcript_39146/m.103528 type:complete len:209 (+) Transcript_39146:2464-3090(+)
MLLSCGEDRRALLARTSSSSTSSAARRSPRSFLSATSPCHEVLQAGLGFDSRHPRGPRCDVRPGSDAQSKPPRLLHLPPPPPPRRLSTRQGRPWLHKCRPPSAFLSFRVHPRHTLHRCKFPYGHSHLIRLDHRIQRRDPLANDAYPTANIFGCERRETGHAVCLAGRAEWCVLSPAKPPSHARLLLNALGMEPNLAAHTTSISQRETK